MPTTFRIDIQQVPVWTFELPQEPGYYWWRDSRIPGWEIPIIRKIVQDRLGLCDEGFSAVTLDTFGGEWQKVSPPLD